MRIHATTRVGLFLCPLLLTMACNDPDEGALPPELSDAIEAFYVAVDSGYGEARIAMFTEGAMMLPNHGTPIEGKSEIADVIRSGSDWVFRIRDREQITSGVSGSLAYTVNSYFYTYHPKGSEPEWHKTKNVHIWKRQISGEWKLHVDIWNSDLPLAEFTGDRQEGR
jgi:ketosteroid isomerase-like protein